MRKSKRIWWYAALLLLVSVLVEPLIERPAHFTWDGLGFFAWYGFFSSMSLIVLAKLLALLLKRSDDYYDKSRPGTDDDR